MAVCEKIFSAFTCCSSTRQTNDHHHISHRYQDPMPASHAQNPSLPTHDHSQKVNDHNQNKIANRNGAKEVTENRQHHVSKPHGGKQEGQKSEQDINDGFSDYINRAKIKIRTITNVGVGGNKSASNSKVDDAHATKNEDDQTKDTFSDYIKRAKTRIRKVTSIRSMKSFKAE